MPDIDSDHFEDEDEVDEQSHKKLLNAVSQLYRKQRISAPQRNEPSHNISEFNFVKSDDKNKVKTLDLLRGLNKKATHSHIKQQVKAIVSKATPLPRPLEKFQADKISREVGYGEVKNELRKWDAIIQKNRASDQLSFPLKNTEVHFEKDANFLSTFTKPSDLELKMAEVLKKSLLVQEGKQEDETQESLSLDDVLERRGMIAKMRARESYRIAKAIRQNKIKSKKYHRVLKRDKIKRELKEFELLQKTDPEAALAKLERVERARAEERISLRHRNTGKWAKGLGLRAKYDVEARTQLADNLRKSRELTDKLKATVGSDSEEEDGEADLGNGLTDNPWVNKADNEVLDFVSGYKKFWAEQNKPKEPSLPAKGSSVVEGIVRRPVEEPVSGEEIQVQERELVIANLTTVNGGDDAPAPTKQTPEIVNENNRKNSENLETIAKIETIRISDKPVPVSDSQSKNGELTIDDADLEIPREKSRRSGGKSETIVENETIQTDSPSEKGEPTMNGADLETSEIAKKRRRRSRKKSKTVGENETIQTTDEPVPVSGSSSEKEEPSMNDANLETSEIPKKKRRRSRKKSKTIGENETIQTTDEPAPVCDSPSEEPTMNGALETSEIPKKKSRRSRKKSKNIELSQDPESPVPTSCPKRKSSDPDATPEKKLRKVAPSKSGNWTVVDDNCSSQAGNEPSDSLAAATNIESLFEKVEVKAKKALPKKMAQLRNQLGKAADKSKGTGNSNNTTDNRYSDLSFKKKKPSKEIDEPLNEISGEGISSGLSDVQKLLDRAERSQTSAAAPKLPDIDPQKFIPVKTQKLKTALPSLEEGGDSEESGDEQQHSNLMEAFADDDIADEFQKEKNRDEEETAPKEINLSLPGWGGWGGAGITQSKKKNWTVKFPKLPRKDENKSKVIITGDTGTSFTKLQVSDLPWQFKRVADYEATVRAPIGDTWVPQAAHDAFIAQQVVTKMGTIIKPMDRSELLKRENKEVKPIKPASEERTMRDKNDNFSFKKKFKGKKPIKK